MNKILTANPKQYGLVNTRLLPLIDGASYVTQRIKAPLTWVLNGRHRWESSLLLNSMRKSGSHYLMALITNYLSLNINQKARRIALNEIKSTYWGSPAQPINSKSKKACDIFERCGCGSFIWTHEDWALGFKKPRFFIFLHRHPLDLLCSRYFYYHKNRNKPGILKPDSPLALAPVELPRILRHYKHGILQTKKLGGISISYEDLIVSPQKTMKYICSYFNIPYMVNLCDLAIEFSSKKHVVKDEVNINSNIGSKNVVGTFVRSGKIGEWKDLIPTDHHDYLLKEISKNGYFQTYSNA